MESLPFRHLYHAEIQGDGLGIIHRIMRMFRKVRPQTIKRNWHYSDVDTVGGICTIRYTNAEGKMLCAYVDCQPEHPPLKIRHV